MVFTKKLLTENNTVNIYSANQKKSTPKISRNHFFGDSFVLFVMNNPEI